MARSGASCQACIDSESAAAARFAVSSSTRRSSARCTSAAYGPNGGSAWNLQVREQVRVAGPHDLFADPVVVHAVAHRGDLLKAAGPANGAPGPQ